MAHNQCLSHTLMFDFWRISQSINKFLIPYDEPLQKQSFFPFSTLHLSVWLRTVQYQSQSPHTPQHMGGSMLLHPVHLVYSFSAAALAWMSMHSYIIFLDFGLQKYTESTIWLSPQQLSMKCFLPNLTQANYKLHWCLWRDEKMTSYYIVRKQY